MFEAKNFEPWSVEMNVWRELLEEVYNEREQLGTGTPEEEDYIRSKVPIKLLTRLIEEGSAVSVATCLTCERRYALSSS
jgi:hypothetical protein